MSFLSALKKEHIVAKPGFNRWLVPPASVAIHLCIGSVYSWSAFNDALERVVGVAAPSAVDWSLGSTQFTYTLAIVFLGLSAAIAGHWLEKVGPRMVGFVAACCWGGGFIIGGLGILQHNIYLLYLGYGVLGGCGLGLGYVSPVATLVRWFPDRRGMATGMAIMGFGGGAMIGFPLKTYLIEKFYVKPDYVGAENAVDAVTNAAGERVVEIAGSLQQVVLVGANEVQKMIVPGEPGFYLVGTGSSGLAGAFFTLGVIY
ncbi:MAG: MFS transporter, partial [Alphaproteobacteria bacterium]|nr:MFS transporter [Alphaproteobacteria bacterium]